MASNAFATGEAFGSVPADGKIVDVVHRDRRLFAAQNARQGWSDARWREMADFWRRVAADRASERLSHPSSVDFTPGVPDSMKSCASKCERRGIGRSGGMHDGEMPLLPERLKRRQRRMQAEEAVEIEHGLARNIDAGPHGVVLRLAVRNHDVQAVGRAALKNYDQTLVAHAGSTAPNAARVRKLGTAAVPTTASALLRRNMRRVMDMKNGSWLSS